MRKFDAEKVEAAAKLLLEGFGEDVNREGLRETPRRVAKFWREMLEGQKYTNEEIALMYKKDFHVGYDSLVVKEITDVYSTCEHHIVTMYNGTAYVAYLPAFWNGVDDSEGYRVIGLSKIPRIVHMCSRRLQLQEKLAADIAECIQIATGSDKVYVRLIMDHGCVSARGAKSEGVTDVTFISPELRKDVEARKEIESKVQEIHLSSVRQ